MSDGLSGTAKEKGNGVVGTATEGIGVIGKSSAGAGVWGISQSSTGAQGWSTTGLGVIGRSEEYWGVWGLAVKGGNGVHGESGKVNEIGKYGSGVLGTYNGDNTDSQGVLGICKNGIGVRGDTTNGTGIFGNSVEGIGVWGVGKKLAGRFDGPQSTVSIETTEILRMLRPSVPTIKNSNSAAFRVGSYEEGICGRTRLDINLADWPVAGNQWGEVAEATVMTLNSNGYVGIKSSNPQAPLSIGGPDSTVDVETAQMMHLRRPGVTGVKNANSAAFHVGSYEPGVCGRTRLDINLADWPVAGNQWGEVAEATVMTLQSNGNVGIGTTSPSEKLQVNGNVRVSGDVVLDGADCAEEFDIVNGDLAEEGTVMVINEDGKLEPSQEAYDKCVAGVVSGAGKYKPGIILDRHSVDGSRLPIALVGKVYCKVDAQYGPVRVGDLLTTSDTIGHAMKASDSSKAFGAVIGKALSPIAKGQGTIPILVALQ